MTVLPLTWNCLHGWMLALVLLLSLFLRVAALEQAPPGFFQDEAATGYDALCLAQSGQNRHGEFLPLFFNSFGDFEEGLHRYLIVPSIWLFGLSVWSVRVVSAAMGTGVVLITYLLARRLYGKTGALAAAVAASVTPWQIHLSRVAVRDMLLPLTFGLGTYLVLCAFSESEEDKKRWKRDAQLICGCALWGLAFYTYTVARLFVPLMLAGFAVIHRNSLLRFWRERRLFLVVGILLFFLASLPMILAYILRFEDMTARMKVIAVGDHAASPFSLATLLTTASNYLPHFSPRHLFLEGDPNPFLYMGGGLLLPSFFPLILLGIWSCIAFRRSVEAQILLLWLLVYPLPDCLTSGGPHAHRSVTAVPIYALLTGLGFLVVKGWIQQKQGVLRIVGISLAILCGIGTFLWFPNQAMAYIREIPGKTYGFYYDGMEQAIGELRKAESRQPLTVLTRAINQPYIFYLFFGNYPPRQFYEDRAALGYKPDDNWLYVVKFDRFRSLDVDLDAPRDSVVLAYASETGLAPVIATVPSRSGNDWKIVDGKDLVEDAWLEGDRRVLRIRKMEFSRSQVLAGQVLQIRFMWRCLEPPKQDVSVALRIEGPKFSWQSDHKWWNGMYPAHKLERGRLMPWSQTVNVPVDAPAGRYVVLAGVRSDSGDLLERGDGRFFQEVGAFEIVPDLPKLDENALAGWIERGTECLLLEQVKASRTTVKPGGKVELTYDWKCLKPPADPLRVAVNLVCGERRLNFDHDLFDGKKDLTQLPVGEKIVEKQTIVIPGDTPPGEYVLEVGLADNRWYCGLLTREGKS
ncbi:MAG TPA: glycosyltransferase family 39 protein, partial [bacterium]|nr:glycosyltransferase family 39 protein [bacterium]